MEPFKLEYLITENGDVPFKNWLSTLDKKTRARIHARMARIRSGNLGDFKNLGQGLYELRLDFGPGYRIYFARKGEKIIILFSGGDKSSQAKDISFARGLY